MRNESWGLGILRRLDINKAWHGFWLALAVALFSLAFGHGLPKTLGELFGIVGMSIYLGFLWGIEPDRGNDEDD